MKHACEQACHDDQVRSRHSYQMRKPACLVASVELGIAYIPSVAAHEGLQQGVRIVIGADGVNCGITHAHERPAWTCLHANFGILDGQLAAGTVLPGILSRFIFYALE